MILIRGHDLVGDLIGRISFTDHVWLLVAGSLPTDAQKRVLDATLVAILRDQAPITPSRDDVIDGGDELFFVTTIAAEDRLRELLSSAPGSIDTAGLNGGEQAGGSAQSANASGYGPVPEDDGFDG